jgi:hypothetical protein
VREAEGRAADLRAEAEQLRRERVDLRARLGGEEAARGVAEGRLRTAEEQLAETAAKLCVEEGRRVEAEGARRDEGEALRARLVVVEGAAKGRADAAEATRAGGSDRESEI